MRFTINNGIKDFKTHADVVHKFSNILKNFPKVSDKTLASGDISLFVKDRVNEVIDAYETAGFKRKGEAEWVELDYPKAWRFEMAGIEVREGYKISKKEFPDYDFGNFEVSISESCGNGGGRHTIRIAGIAYGRKITRAEFETRWRLQITDGVSAATAIVMAEKLCS